MDAMSISGSTLEGVVPEDTFITVALAVAIIVDLAVRYATKVGDRWLCPFASCLQVDVSSKDSLRHHLHRIHYRPSERLLCPADGCNKDFGYYLDLNRHCHQFHLRIGHVCPKRCGLGQDCPGAIDRRGATPDAYGFAPPCDNHGLPLP
ncbi:MAG: hypothetical protein BYD32DRAFT_418008 [Podila humilis]|nr:MAG: hypothetical protein BYD32DRAFT_418008 [Podila humilis]